MKLKIAFIPLILSIFIPVLTGAATILMTYKTILYERFKEQKTIEDNYNKINILNRESKETRETLKHLDIQILRVNDGLDRMNENINEIKNYQETLRKEVKEIAETKLNTTDFWHYINLSQKKAE